MVDGGAMQLHEKQIEAKAFSLLREIQLQSDLFYPYFASPANSICASSNFFF